MEERRHVSACIKIMASQPNKWCENQENIGKSAGSARNNIAFVFELGRCFHRYKESVAFDLDVPEFDGERQALRGERQHIFGFPDEQTACFRFDLISDAPTFPVEKRVEQFVPRKFDDRNEELSAVIAGQLHLDCRVEYETLFEEEALVAQFESVAFPQGDQFLGVSYGSDQNVDVAGI